MPAQLRRGWLLGFVMALGFLAALGWWRWESRDETGHGDEGQRLGQTSGQRPGDVQGDPETSVPERGSGYRPRASNGSPAPGPLAGELAKPTTQRVAVDGQVLSKKSGTPVAFVDVIFATKSGEATATSDEQGAYSLLLSPGSYQVRAIGDRVMAIGLPPFVLGLNAKRYDVKVEKHSVIRGQVHFADKRPAVGAIVVPEAESGGHADSSARGELGSAEVLEDGSFELFTLQGNLIVHATSSSAAGSVRVPALRSGETREGLRITMVPNGYIEGRVRDPSGAALGEAKVLASMQIPGTGEYDRIPIATDANGHFRYQVLRPVHTIVEASAMGFAQSSPIAFTLKAGESRKDLVLVLQPATLELSGRVLDVAGEPLAYAEVAQGQEGSKERYKKVLTNSEGEFKISGLGPGPHRLRTRKAGYEQTRLRDLTAPASDLRIEMASETDAPAQ